MIFLSETSGPSIQDSPEPGWIFDQIEDWARRAPERVAFILDRSGKPVEHTYADVLKRAADAAAVHAANGVGRGDHAGILMENTPEWVYGLLGAMQLGAVAVPLATALPEDALERIAAHAGCKIILADEANWEKASHVAGTLGCALDRLTERRGSQELHFSPASGSDAAMVIYTSGTTGNPKGVELSFDNLNYEIRGVVEALRLTPDHRILSVLPFSHVLPLIANGLGPLCIGATVVFLSSISPQRIVEAFHRRRITLFICVPQFFYLLHKRIFAQAESQPYPVRLAFRWMKAAAARLQNPALRRRLFAKVHRTIGPDLQILASGGSHFDPAIARDLSDLGYTALQAYGLTETAAAATVTPPQANRIGTVGKPIRGVSIRIDRPNGKGIGEVLIRGPIVMRGYYRAPRETTEAIRDGWFHTGDLGFLDQDGYLSITGRIKDVIVLANGENVYPEELETHYAKSPYIQELCILDMGGLHAVVTPDLEEFRRRGQTNIVEMIRFDLENLSRQLPSFYRIHSLSVRNEPLPRTVTRKLRRFEIAQEELARAGAKPSPPATDRPTRDDMRFESRAGAVIAKLVHDAKPEAGALDPAMNLELDLGFDSLARVELLGLAEAQLGAHIDEREAGRIFTLGELVDAFEAAAGSTRSAGASWKKIIETAGEAEVGVAGLFERRPLLDPLTFAAIRVVKLAARTTLGLGTFGLEKLPRMPFLLCPNHESYLDGPLLVSVLPRRVIYGLFILGYSDYWKGWLSCSLAQLCKIVPIDPDANLVRAMQAGAVGLKRGRPLIIFPEGTRSIDGRMAEFKKGAAILAFELDVPIVPIGIRGSFEAWPRGGGFRFHPIEIHFGEAIHPRTFAAAADPYAAITKKLEDDVRTLAGDAN